MAEFLGLSLTQERIQTISAQSTFPAMRAKAPHTHGALGPFLFRKGKVAVASRTPVHLYGAGDPCHLILNQTGCFFLNKKTGHGSELEPAAPPCLLVEDRDPSTLCDDEGAAKAPPLH